MDSGKTGTHTTTRRGMTAREAWLASAACAAVSAALVFLCSSTSPLFSIMSDDSSIFLVVGKYWREGWLPYRDLWDSKGPFLFLVNAIGYSITSSPLGVALLQVAFMSATLFFTYKLLRCEFGAGRSALAAFGVFCTLAYVYGSGDTAEEFVMPLIAWLFYRLHRWLDGSRQDFPLGDALLCGVAFGLCFGTRLTNAVGLCAAALAVACILASRRRWGCLSHCAAAFVAGAAAAVVPFVAYFACHGALGDMMYGALLYNLEYKTERTGFTLIDYGKGFCSAFACLALLAVSVAQLAWGQRRRAACWLAVSLATLVYLANTHLFPHYFMITAPYLAIAVIEAGRMAQSHPLPARAGAWVMAAVLATSLAYRVHVSLFQVNYVRNFSDPYAKLMALVPADERDSFVAYNCATNIYLRYDMKPAYRFFYLQDWMAYQGPSLRKLLLDDFGSCRAKWIMTQGDVASMNISGLLASRYELVGRSEPFGVALFRLRDASDRSHEGRQRALRPAPRERPRILATRQWASPAAANLRQPNVK